MICITAASQLGQVQWHGSFRFKQSSSTLLKQRCPHRLQKKQLGSLREDTDRPTDDEQLLLRDMERYRQRDEQQQVRDLPGSSGRFTEDKGGSAASGAKELLDKVLIADFFFVCAALAWLVAGVGAKTALGNSALLDAWYPLWQWVFQPSIGVLMLGAILSGLVSWVQKNSS